MVEVGPREIAVRDYRRSTREMVVDLAQGKVLRTQRRESDEVSGIGMRQRGKPLLVYKRPTRSAEGLVAQRGRTILNLDQPGCVATVTQSFFGLRSRVRIACGDLSLCASQWTVLSSVMSRIDPTWDRLDEDSEDFVGWLKEVVNNPALRTHLIKTWNAADQSA